MTKPTKIGVGVGIAVFRNGQVLLGLRNPDKVKASSELKGEGTWTMPGGKVDPGEKLVDAAIRELDEETGIKLDALSFVCVQDNIIDAAHYVTVGFQASVTDNYEANAMEPETILKWEWYDIDKLPKNMYLPSSQLLKCILSDIVYL